MQMTVTWTSGYALNEAVPFVEWGVKGKKQIQSAAATLTIDQNSMCGIVYFNPPMTKPHCITINCKLITQCLIH